MELSTWGWWWMHLWCAQTHRSHSTHSFGWYGLWARPPYIYYQFMAPAPAPATLILNILITGFHGWLVKPVTMAAYTNEARKANLMLRQALYDHGHVENISGARAVQTQQKACRYSSRACRYSRGSHVHKNALITELDRTESCEHCSSKPFWTERDILCCSWDLVAVGSLG